MAAVVIIGSELLVWIIVTQAVSSITGGTAGMGVIDKGRLVHSRIFGHVDTVEPISAVSNEAKSSTDMAAP